MRNRNAAILLVEDNRRINIANRDMLELMGFEVYITETLAGARRRLTAGNPDVVVLDIMLPDGSGLDFLGELRESGVTAHIPVILLTALGTPDDTVAGLAAGADDYLAKPYEYKVLAARIEALLRRAARVPETLIKGALHLDSVAGRAFLNGEDMLLTPKEFALLFLLVKNPGRILSAKYLYEAVWKQPLAGDSRTLRKHMSALRKKLDGGGADCTVVIEYGKGYYFQDASGVLRGGGKPCETRPSLCRRTHPPEAST
jgi:DNA-binding response OmpR family regulator